MSTDETRPASAASEIAAPVHSRTGGRFVAGTVLANRYRIVGLLGLGGMGEVYKAEDLWCGAAVAAR